MKTEVKTEVKEEPFEKFESREQEGIDLITSKNFDHSLAKSELTEMKTGHVKSSCMNILSLILLVQG